MRFLIIRKADADTEAGAMPTRELVDAMMRYNAEMIDAGVMEAGEGLLPSSQGARVVFRGGSPTVIDGPFTEAKELVAGFSIIDVPTLADAVAWMRRWPVEDGNGNVELEIRPLITAETFGEEFAADIRGHEERLRARAAAG